MFIQLEIYIFRRGETSSDYFARPIVILLSAYRFSEHLLNCYSTILHLKLDLNVNLEREADRASAASAPASGSGTWKLSVYLSICLILSLSLSLSNEHATFSDHSVLILLLG